jgi:nucleotide-binding universal stress UspA family protein
MPFASCIVVATDFSTAARTAFAPAKEIAESTGGKLHLVHVWDSSVPRPSDEGARLASAKESEPHLVERLEDLAKEHLGNDVTVKVICRNDVDEAICAYAEEVGADLIVIATQGATGLKRLILGSVAEKIVRHARCAVLTVRRHDADS